MSGFRISLALVIASGCTGSDSISSETGGGSGDDSPAITGAYRRVDLVSDQVGAAAHVDPILVNGWGIAPGEGGFWIAAEDTGKMVIYDGNGIAATGEYTSGSIDLGAGITGVAANETKGFVVSTDKECQPAQFIVSSIPGELVAVNGDLNSKAGFVVVDRKGSAAYFGVAIAMVGVSPRLYAADFMNARIDVFDDKFVQLELPGAFVDPDLPEDMSPFNVIAQGDRIYVMYADMELEDDGPEEQPGPGAGAVNVFDTTGKLLMRLATGGTLNAPWGLAIAPANFGPFSGDILVGNFGDGRINAFDADTGRLVGQIADADGPVEISGLWGLTFGNGDEAGLTNVLYFAAGPDEEAHGLFGRIETTDVVKPPTKPPTMGPHFDVKTGTATQH